MARASEPAADGAAAVVRTTAVAVGSSVPSPAATPTTRATRRAAPLLLALGASPRPAAGLAGPLIVPSLLTPGPPLREFDGIDAAQNLAASGFDAEPPDEGFGASPAYEVNFVNVTGAVYGPTGALLGAPFYLNDFFHEPGAAFTTDPRVFFDSSANRWFATILEITFDADQNTTESHVDLAVSAGPDPTGSWRVYRIDTTNPAHAGCPCLADYPILGIDRYNVYISTNEFTSDGLGFNGAQLYALPKSQLIGGVSNPTVVAFANLSVAGDPAYHVQPADTYGFAPAEFMMSSLDPASTTDDRLAVWALTDPWTVGSHAGLPQLLVHVIGSEPYSFPPNAQTPPGFCPGSLCGGGGSGEPTTGVVASDFDAMEEVQYIDGQLVGALATGVTVPGDTEQRAGAAWFVVNAAIDPFARRLTAATRVMRQGYLAQAGEYLLYPHINMTDNGAMAMAFTLGGPSTFLSAAFSTAPPGGRFTTIRIAAAGTGPDNGATGTADNAVPPGSEAVGRWGDYSGGEILPGTNKVWLATGYIPNAGDGNANWGNAIFEVGAP